MTPIEKAEFSRRNGQMSEGPTSAEGKRIVSRNALKHGLASETIPVKSEEHAAYTLKLQTWVAQLAPNSLVELMLVERICRNSWKLEKIAENPPEDEVLDLRLAMADNDESAAELERELRLLARYEQAAERHFHKALNMLLKLRSKPELLAAPTPAPIPAPPPKSLVIPPAPNKPSFFGDLNPVLNVSAARPPIVNGKTHRAGLQ